MSFITVPPRNSPSALAPLYELEPPPPASPRRGQLQNALYRHRWPALLLLLACVGLAAGASRWVRPYYEASGTLIVAHPSLHPTELTPVDYTPPPDPDREMQTQLTILGSRAVAAAVISGLELERRDPEIAGAIAAAARGAAKQGRRLSPLERAQLAAAVFASKLKLAPNQLSSTVAVRYGSHDPSLAARVVNATAAAFMAQTLADRAQQGDEATPWMRQQVAAAEQELERDDAAVAGFQQQHSYIPLLDAGGTQSGLLDQLGDANHAYSAAVAERIADEAAARSFAGATGGVVAALPAELRDPAIDRAAENVGAAQQQLTTLQTTYQPDFPLVVEARQQLDGAQQKLAGLRAQVQAGLEQRLASSRQREQALAELVAGLSQQAAAASGVEMQFGVLRARADSQRTLVAALRQKLSELELAASLPPSHIQMLDPALPPDAPAYPRLSLDLGLGLGLGLTLALGTALARERWEGTLTAAEAVKRGLGPALAPLGMIAEQPRHRAGARALLPAASGLGAAGYQKAAANLVARCGAPPRAILITSPSPGEGKT
ncbi:MAG: GumC family protein, partial [Terriglobales bacterium]